MAASVRSALAVSVRLASIPKPPVLRAAFPKRASLGVMMSRRAFTGNTSQLKKTEVIKETEVPVSVYTPDSKGVASANSDHFSIPVTPSTPPSPVITPHEVEEKDMVTLDAKLYRQMPPTLQKMSVMGKVIVVTG